MAGVRRQGELTPFGHTLRGRSPMLPNEFVRSALVATIGVALFTHDVAAQQERRRSPAGEPPAGAERGVPRDPNFPYAGLWKGMRTMPMGHDSIGLAFAVEDGKYA